MARAVRGSAFVVVGMVPHTLACPMFISKCQGAHEEVKARPRFPPFITMAETRSRPDCFFAGRYQLGKFSCFFSFSFPTFASSSVSVGASTLVGRLRSAGQVGFVLFVHRECWDPRAMTYLDEDLFRAVQWMLTSGRGRMPAKLMRVRCAVGA